MALSSILQRLKDVLIEDYIAVGTIQSSQSGLYLVSVSGTGGLIQAKGAPGYEPGDFVLVRNGVILSKLPACTFYEMEVN